MDSQDKFLDIPPEDFEPVDLTSAEEEALPDNYLHGSYPAAVAIIKYLNQIEPLWRLDSLIAVDDYLDELDDGWESLTPLDGFRSWFVKRRYSPAVRRSSWTADVDGGVVGWVSGGDPVDHLLIPSGCTSPTARSVGLSP